MEQITNEKIDKYLVTTKTALSNISISKQSEFDWKKMAEEFLDMATRYYKDAEFYKDKGDLVTAFAACNYAHGWIDAGARLGLFDAPPGSDDVIMPK